MADEAVGDSTLWGDGITSSITTVSAAASSRKQHAASYSTVRMWSAAVPTRVKMRAICL